MSSNFPSMTKILEKASDVSIIRKGMIKIARQVITYLDKAIQNGDHIKVMNNFMRYYFYSNLYPNCWPDCKAMDYIFVLHTLNFSLGSPKGTDLWIVNGYTGFLALFVAMKRAICEEKPMWNPIYYKELVYKPEDVKIIFRSDNGTCIPMLQERLDLLHEVGEILLKQYKGTFLTCLHLCKNENDLIKLLVNKFPSYQKKVMQYKGIRDTFEFESVENLEIIASTCKIRSQLRIELVKLLELYKINNPDKRRLIEEIPSHKYEILIDNFLWEYRHKHDQYLMENVLSHNVRSVYF